MTDLEFQEKHIDLLRRAKAYAAELTNKYYLTNGDAINNQFIEEHGKEECDRVLTEMANGGVKANIIIPDKPDIITLEHYND